MSLSRSCPYDIIMPSDSINQGASSEYSAAWTGTLQEVLHLMATTPAEVMLEKERWRFLDLTAPYPFEEILTPFIVVAQQRYLDQTRAVYHLLLPEAHLTLQRSLLHVLTSLSIQALHATLQAYEQGQMILIEHSDATKEVQADKQDIYQCFIEYMYTGGLITFLRKYSVLAHLLATTVDLWVEAHTEFLQRLATDWLALQRTFCRDEELGRVAAIQPTLSDPHTGRRCVMALHFSSGFKLVYKPKNIGIEESYYHLLHWCNEQGATPPFKVLTLLNRHTHGWVEFVEQEPCQDLAAVQRYSQRAGMLLCILYLLGGVDCSYQHIIANGEHPLLIDPEVLLHAYPCPDHREQAEQGLCSEWEQELYSVLHTGLLSTWEERTRPGQENIPIDISGFALSNGKHVPPSRTSARSRQMALQYGFLKPRSRLNIAIYDGAPLQLAAQSREACSGFQHIYQLILHHRDQLLADGSPLLTLQGQPTRVPYRVSRDYAALLSELLAPQALSDLKTCYTLLAALGKESIPVDYRLWQEGDQDRWRAVCEAEVQTILQGDIPVFRTFPGSNALLIAPDQELPSCLHQPAFDLLQTRLAHWGEEDMQFQLALLQSVLPQKNPSTGILIAYNKEREEYPISSGEPLLNTLDILLTHASKIAEDIARTAVSIGDGGVTWVGAGFLHRYQHHQLQPMRFSLFSGAGGVALFLAAWASISGDSSHRKLARAALRPVQQTLRRNGEYLLQEMGIGGAIGVGSLVYAFTRIGQLLDEPQFFTAAQDAARLITAERIASDRELDIIAGSAGALLCLLALYGVTGDQWILDRALLCGQHLLHSRTMSQAGCRAWPTIGGQHTTGFSHGTAGIVYALVRLYAVTGNADLLDAAREGLLYEDAAFLSQRGNWAEILGDQEGEEWMTWCHGAPGIGLARIGGISHLSSPQIYRDIEVALETTKRFGVQALDHVCCGNSGRAELLLTTGLRLERPDLVEGARAYITGMIARAEQREAFALHTSLPRQAAQPHSDYEFFHGLPGIGYTLLRMASPERLPSVLLWE